MPGGLREGRDFGSERGDEAGLLGGGGGVRVVVVDADVAAVPGVFEGDGAADASGGAGDDGSFVKEELGGESRRGGAACGGRGGLG